MKKTLILFILVMLVSGCSIGQSSKKIDEHKAVNNDIVQKEVSKDTISFGGRDFNLSEKENINNGVAFYFRDSESSEKSQSEIIINAYSKEIKAEELSKNVQDHSEKRGSRIYQSFTAPDKNKKDAFYITSLSIYFPDEPYADIYLMKIFSVDRTYMIIYRESLPGVGEVGLELIADSWLNDNAENYSKAIEGINPETVLANQNIQEKNDGIFIEDDQSSNPDLKTVSVNDVDLSTISEETFSEDQLKSYYASYKNPYVLHLRKVLDVYLVDRFFGMDMPDVVVEKKVEGSLVYGLSAFDRNYYKSKFIVWQIDDHTGGGKDITLIFQDKPDKIFHAWVYQLGDKEGTYDLRAFWENTESSKGIKVLLKAYGKYILDKEHSL